MSSNDSVGYTIERVDVGVTVTGYSDGSQWSFLPELPPESVGVAGPEHVWCCDRRGMLHVLHAPARTLVATVALGEVHRTPGAIWVSRDGRRLYALVRDGGDTALTVIDVATGHVDARYTGLPAIVLAGPVERPDGRVLLSALGLRIVSLDPHTGEQQESTIPDDLSGEPGFVSASPDARWWLRFDRAVLPTHEAVPGLVDRWLGRKPGQRRYGLTFQLWEAFPLRFVRRIVVAWLAPDEMPKAASPRGAPQRARLWDPIAAVRGWRLDDPLVAQPPRSAYPANFVATDAQWEGIQRSLDELSRWARVERWTPDCDAFWVGTNGFLSCVGVDGSASPRLYTERLGLRTGTWLPAATSYRQIEPLESRRARIIYPEGTAVFDGTPHTAPYEPQAIPATRDNWVPRGGDPVGSTAAARHDIERLIAARRQTQIPLREWSEAACVAAIDALAAQINDDMYQRAVHDELRLVFELDGQAIGEAEFFGDVQTSYPGAAPAIRRLVERYCDVARPLSPLYSDAGKGHEFLAYAAHALGVLDPSALPILRRYGALVDVEHQYHFASVTVPAIIAAHGWTDATLDFVFWVLAWDFYNTLSDYGRVWNSWGIGDAVRRHEPRAFARRLAAGLADTIRAKDDPGYYGTGGFDRLAREVPPPHDAWLTAFLEELHVLIGDPEAKRPPVRPTLQ